MDSPKPSLIQKIFLLPVYLYRILISPLLGPNCRYCPTCSSYMIQAVSRHGILRGFTLGITRILRCNALFTGGNDPVPETFSFSQIKVDWKKFRNPRKTRKKTRTDNAEKAPDEKTRTGARADNNNKETEN